jgi:GTP-binding protein HflX
LSTRRAKAGKPPKVSPPGLGSGRALVLHPFAKSGERGRRSPEARLDEAVGLAQAIGLDVVIAECAALGRRQPSTLLGAGKVEELELRIADERVEVAVIDAGLTPVQQRNLEKALNCKVIDRTGLILEIFGERARTAEGRLQVELAQLEYQRGRLVRSWTHLERQRGGLGKTGGPGESQLEADRRLIDERIVRLKRELEQVARTRELHRKRRRQAPWPVVALVGYTNAGKSTLFNRLTRADVLAENMLFATLDPTMRSIDLPSGRRIVLSDTVGFISDLPTHLVAAFRATLEEVLEADLLLHVRDVAHPDAEAQKADVEGVLQDLGVDEEGRDAILEVLNKTDLLAPERRAYMENLADRRDNCVAVSALAGEGVERLLKLIDERLAGARETIELAVDLGDGAGLAWLYQHGEVLSRSDADGVARLTVGLDPQDLGRFRKRFAR